MITQPASSPAVFAAFDSDGHLWVSQGAPANKIVRYTISDPIDMAAPVQDVVVSSPDLVNPQGIAFDAAHGDLWVACEGNDSVVSFHRERLGAAYTGAADVALTAKTGAGAAVAFSYTAPTGIAFDQAGNLWVGFQDHLIGFTPAQQAATALVAGPIDLAISTGTGGFAFDESGGLWISGGNPNFFRRLPKTALAASGTPTPDIVITSDSA